MKNIAYFVLVFFGIKNGIMAQDFKHFQPQKDPFKVFELPKFPQIVKPEGKSDFALKRELLFSELDHMPIMKSGEITDEMPVYKPSNKVKYSLLTVDPLKKEEVLVPEK